jgi:hypothetical protein
MTINRTRELMMISLQKAIELYLSTLATEGKSLRYINRWKGRKYQRTFYPIIQS